MYKVNTIPSPRSDLRELADFIEIQCLKEQKVSKRAIIAALGRVGENDISQGNRIDDRNELKVDNVFKEIEQRIFTCNGFYPFSLELAGNVLSIDNQNINNQSYLYRYLLLATRMNMQSDRTQGNIDGTLLFEDISVEIVKEYFGERSKSFLFGTSNQTDNFEVKVNALCTALNEGSGFINRNLEPPSYVKDDSLDIVAWIPFTDNKAGKMIAFGQCKTGTSWSDSLTSLIPEYFLHKWVIDYPSLTPVRLFFLSESLERTRWHTLTTDAGILFDRNRIMDFSANLSQTISEKIISWTNAAMDFITEE